MQLAGLYFLLFHKCGIVLDMLTIIDNHFLFISTFQEKIQI